MIPVAMLVIIRFPFLFNSGRTNYGTSAEKTYKTEEFFQQLEG